MPNLFDGSFPLPASRRRLIEYGEPGQKTRKVRREPNNTGENCRYRMKTTSPLSA